MPSGARLAEAAAIATARGHEARVGEVHDWDHLGEAVARVGEGKVRGRVVVARG